MLNKIRFLITTDYILTLFRHNSQKGANFSRIIDSCLDGDLSH